METTIGKLFDSKNRKFEIPSYQRAYAWEEKQITQFIEDINNAEKHYYLGHYPFETKPSQENTLFVIDGQQRLTTCIIFFSALKNELERRQVLGEVININLDDIKDYYLRDIRKETQKFKTVGDDNNFFVDEVIDSVPDHSQVIDTSSKSRIRAAKQIFQKEFSNCETPKLEKW